MTGERHVDLEAAGGRISELLDQLGGLPDRRAGEWATELVCCLTDIYGECLARVVEAVAESDGASCTVLQRLLGDDLVTSLLIVHDLHPESLRSRVLETLEKLRRENGEADFALIELDEESSRVRLRVVAGPEAASGAAAERRLRAALEVGAPELETVEIDRLLPSTPVRFSSRRTGEIPVEVARAN